MNLSGILGILFPLYYLYTGTENRILIIAIPITVLVLCQQFNFNKSKQKEVNRIKDENERRWNIIGRRDIFAYRGYLNKVMRFNICYSDKDAQSYILSTILRILDSMGARTSLCTTLK